MIKRNIAKQVVFLQKCTKFHCAEFCFVFSLFVCFIFVVQSIKNNTVVFFVCILGMKQMNLSEALVKASKLGGNTLLFLLVSSFNLKSIRVMVTSNL